MKTFLRFVLLALILVSVAMVSALTAMRFAIHGREVAVPKLIGLSQASAEQQANADGLIVDVENHFYSADIAEGRVISQSPAPGSLVRRGWKVRVAESLGPQKAEVPDLVGQSARAAEINVRQRGLEVGSVAVADLPDAAQDEIVAQSPPPNSGMVESPKISVLVAGEEKDQQFLMPDFVGKHVGEVRKEIEDAGFTLSVRDPGFMGGVGQNMPNMSKDDAEIVKQIPSPGQRIKAGSDITVEVSHPMVPLAATFQMTTKPKR
jgi:eukaryotic-like serine/threonine-protein kinase